MAFQMASGFITNPSDIPIAAYAIVNGPLHHGFASSGMALLRRTKRARWAIRLFSPFLFLWGAAGLAAVAFFLTQLDRYEARGLEVSWINRLNTPIIFGMMILVASYSLWLAWSGKESGKLKRTSLHKIDLRLIQKKRPQRMLGPLLLPACDVCER